jgi:hypothetical protein
MKGYIFVLLLCAALLLVAAPLAAEAPSEVGERINVLFGTPDTFPAGEPFHIWHGWDFPVEDWPPGHFDFQLEMDGVVQSEDHFFVFPILWQGSMWQLRVWLYNFPDGMTGTHTFTGHWIAPCQYAVEEYGYPGPCPNPNVEVEALTESLTVRFTP